MKNLIRNQNLLIKLALGALLLAIFIFEFNITEANNAYLNSKSISEVRVLNGDSVWTIAAKFVTDKEDIRDLIVAIRQINGLSPNAEIHPGQVLKIPLKTKERIIVEPIMAKTP